VTKKFSSHNTKNIVLLGIGHTNAHILKHWAHEPIADCRLICLSNFPTATYSGMLPGTLGRQFRREEMRIELAPLVAAAGAELLLGDTTGLDLHRGEIQIAEHAPVRFDVLSIGVGSMPAGWQQQMDSPLVVPIKPMQTFLERLDAHLQQVFDRAESSSPTEHPVRIAIVGGGVAGVEITLCLQQQIGQRRVDHPWSIEIFTSRDQVADGMHGRSVQRLTQILADRDISVHFRHRVSGVGSTGIRTEDGRYYPADCVIWATGATAPPVLGKLGLETDERGFVATTNTLQSLTDPRIFAVGDSGTIVTSPAPKAGVYAVRQCPILWHNLRALIDGRPLRTYQPQGDFLKIINTGDDKALLEYKWLTFHARWCWQLKTWIDKSFVAKFQ